MDYFDRVVEILRSYETVGVRILENGTRLIGHVPHVAPEAWLHGLFPPLSATDIVRMESELGIQIPRMLSEYYARSNGMYAFSHHLYIRGIRRSFSRVGDDAWQPFSIRTPNVDERLRNAKPTSLFIGGYQPDGSKLFIDVADARVYRCGKLSAKPLNEWPSFDVMLESEVRRLATLFDLQGKILNPSKPTTPENTKRAW